MLSRKVNLLFLFILLSINVYAGESENNIEANSEKANRIYSSGIKHMLKAKQILIVGDSAFAYNYRATSDAKAKREYEKAIIEFKAALEIDSSKKEAYNNLGFCYRKLGKLDKSLKTLHQAIKLDSNFVQALENIGETYLILEEIEMAKKYWNELVTLKSELADTLAHAINTYNLNKINKTLQRDKK